MDGAAGWPLPDRNNRTCLELARTPNLDALVRESRLGLVRTVPRGMEPSSACACMSVLGYDPKVYYRGRSAIEAKSMGIPIGKNEVVFRCNLVAVRDGKMRSYSAGYVSNEEAHQLIASLDRQLGNDNVHFYPGIGYRHILKLKGQENTLQARCTPPHDITDKPIAEFLPQGPGSDFLRALMERSEAILRDHPVNIAREKRGETPATTIWLFWSSGQIPEMPPFKQVYGISAAMTSGVDLLRGLAKMAGMTVLEIAGVTDNLDNNFASQADGGLAALRQHDLVVIHIEAPDEAAHDGSIANKVAAIEQIDKEVISRLRAFQDDKISILIMPDHPTPIKSQTHNDEPVPFALHTPGINSNHAVRFTEAEAKKMGILVENGYTIMKDLVYRG